MALKARCRGGHLRADPAVDAGVVQGLQVRLLVGGGGQLRQHPVRIGVDPALLDAAALGDPFVAGVHDLSEQVVGYHVVRHIHARV